MATTTAPLPSQTILTLDDGSPNYTMRTRLDGRDFNFHFKWNEREERWYCDISSDADVPLAMGIKIVTNRPLTRFYLWDTRLPPGDIVACSLTADQSPPGLYDLAQGKRVELTYFPTGV